MTAQSIADIGLQLGKLVADFTQVERIPRWANNKRETDVEHSYLLSLVACELAAAYYPELQTGLVAEFANVHDLVEVKVGDTPTFLATPEQLRQKDIREHAALKELQAELPAHTAEMLTRYEEQREPEACFVKIVDKMTPAIVNVVGGNLRPMYEDYNIHNSADFLKYAELRTTKFSKIYPDFPEIIEACKLLQQHLATTFKT